MHLLPLLLDGPYGGEKKNVSFAWFSRRVPHDLIGQNILLVLRRWVRTSGPRAAYGIGLGSHVWAPRAACVIGREEEFAKRNKRSACYLIVASEN